MNVFEIRNRLVNDYASYIHSFINIRDECILSQVRGNFSSGLLWPEPLIQLNPSFEPGETIDQLVDHGILHPECRRIFRIKLHPKDDGRPLRLHKHQADAVKQAKAGHNYVLTTGTGSGKSLAYIVPIVDHVLRYGSGKGIQAIVIYPMNALANSQAGELEKFLSHGYPDGKGPVTFKRYTGQEKKDEKDQIVAAPPDILLTNYVMLELILTRPDERNLIRAGKGLKFLVLDELHTYRGRQGADVALLVRRVRNALAANKIQFVGTSATLAAAGSYEEQQRQVSDLAGKISGSEVRPENVIGETLRRATPPADLKNPTFLARLSEQVVDASWVPPSEYGKFVNQPLAMWIETAFGVESEPGGGRLVRVEPRSITGEEGTAQELSQLTGAPQDLCVKAIQNCLLASYRCEPNPETRFPPFAFRLHQFISRGDTVYASCEPESKRHITLQCQRFVPGDRSRILLPLVFCRECGQEYYSVRMSRDAETQSRTFSPRELSDLQSDDDTEAGFLYYSATEPWPVDTNEVINRLPDDWIEYRRGIAQIRPNRRDDLPRPVRVAPDGRENAQGIDAYYFAAPFRFCLRCRVSYGFRLKSDFAKLSTLSSEGRSTATTILSLSLIRNLKEQLSLPRTARKLLSFTDNRQDASLQAGHFNDFVEVSLLRSALYKAVSRAGVAGITHERLTQCVFDALALPLSQFARDPDVRFQALVETQRALRDVLGYRIYYDLRRGWRITSPNLEQCGLLEIRYLSLNDLCQEEDVWKDAHPALSGAKPATRGAIAKVLLDHMRRELGIKVDYLNPVIQEQIQQRSSQHLIPPWAFDEDEILEHAAVLYPRASSGNSDYGGNVYLSPRGGFGQFLRRQGTFEDFVGRLTLDDTHTICGQLLEALRVAGLVEVVSQARDEDDVPGYQLPASAMCWVAGDGTRSLHDPIRVPNIPERGSRTNPFFVDFYRTVAEELVGLEAREHTAQVPYELRLEREESFREGRLPVLYCSPTMELGVDIAELNAVNMRNIPPTPANYAQRSGRAGRSGQPALVFTYCSTGNSHDQYFFKRPERMVAGAVTPARLDLTNEDLIRSHVHAIWLAETKQGLGTSLKDILDVTGENPTLALQAGVQASVETEAPKLQAQDRATQVLATIFEELKSTDWFTDRWLSEVLAQVHLAFDRACDRWRGLYRAALKQRETQNRIIADASRSADDKAKAKRLRQEAESQLDLLTEAENVVQADFYSYRYFASEGFLPGYNFPRLPLSAYIPGRRLRQGRDEFLSRPRFLAISEFGPRAIVYHEGSRYQISKAILPVGDDGLVSHQAKLCPTCGYLHPVVSEPGCDLCEFCDSPLRGMLRPLFRLQNVSTKRRDKINSDEEERLRLGYEICTAVRFVERAGRPSYRVASVEHQGTNLATLTYGQAATLWRINLGERRRRQKDQYGFILDLERGLWGSSLALTDDNANEDPMSPRTARVIPYVEDHRNCLLLKPNASYPESVMASLQAALKAAIQVRYQLEDNELAVEPLPLTNDRRLILFYESAEGGAGVLRRLLDDRLALSKIARDALHICHIDPDSGEDLRRALRSREDCEAACYDCLMNYGNQRDHKLLDRKGVRQVLLQLASAEIQVAPAAQPRGEHLESLLRLAGSQLERRWLQFLELNHYRLPTQGQVFMEACKTRPDFIYDDCQAAVYVDGPPHEYPERRTRDSIQNECMEDLGYTVIRFGAEDDWSIIIDRFPHIFGKAS